MALYYARTTVNGHHVYTWKEIFPFLYKFRVGDGRWRITTRKRALKYCERAEDRMITRKFK
jgi:hypothetical protein